jgi:hypothetical protein
MPRVTATCDAATLIFGNHPSTDHDDVFGGLPLGP